MPINITYNIYKINFFTFYDYKTALIVLGFP